MNNVHMDNIHTDNAHVDKAHTGKAHTFKAYMKQHNPTKRTRAMYTNCLRVFSAKNVHWFGSLCIFTKSMYSLLEYLHFYAISMRGLYMGSHPMCAYSVFIVHVCISVCAHSNVVHVNTEVVNA